MLLLPCKGTTWSREEGELRKLRGRINIRHNIRRRQCWQWGSAAAGWRNDSGCPYEYFPSRLWSFGASDVGLREGEGQSWRRCLLRRVLLLFGSNYTQPLKSTQESVLNHHFYNQKRFPPPLGRDSFVHHRVASLLPPILLELLPLFSLVTFLSRCWCLVVVVVILSYPPLLLLLSPSYLLVVSSFIMPAVAVVVLCQPHQCIDLFLHDSRHVKLNLSQ